MTFTLPGFSIVKREGVELPANFTATINADLRVGALEETVTVTGASPVVDVKSATQQQVLSRDLLDALPTGRNIWAVGSTLSGISLSAPDVGGTAGMQQTYMAVHGSDRRDNAIQVDGMSVNGIEGDGAIQNYFNDGMFQEMSYQTSALTAEIQTSGVRLNMIPKEGGNQFHGSLFMSRTPGSWQTNNFTDELRLQGLQAPNRVEKIQDFNPGFGGPIKRNKLWFFSSFRRWGVDQTITDSFYNLDPTHKTYVPANGLNGRRAEADRRRQHHQERRRAADVADGVEAQVLGLSRSHRQVPRPRMPGAVRWKKRAASAARNGTSRRRASTPPTLSSRLLVEAGFSENDETYSTNEAQASVGPDAIARFDRTTTEALGRAPGPVLLQGARSLHLHAARCRM